MARSKPTPERSAIARAVVKAFARRHRTNASDGDDDEEEDKPDAPADKPAAAAEPVAPAAKAPEQAAASAKTPAKDVPEIEPPPPKGEPWPDATPEPMRPVEPPNRAHTETVLMKIDELGEPPEMPTSVAPRHVAHGDVEDPTHMPGPREIPEGNPEDPAPPPGNVPRGDSRSMRRGNDFALVYRVTTFVISRVGTVGKRGQWRVVEYPTSSSAAHSYARECSRFVSEGFSDYRD